MPVIERIGPDRWRAAPWGAGQGVTHELARWGTGAAPAVRMSVAEIHRAGRFTPMPGRRRWLAVLDDGGGLAVTVDGASRRLGVSATMAFAGDAEVAAAIAGPARVWNLVAAADVAFSAAWIAGPTEVDAAAGTVVVFAVADAVVTIAGHAYPLAADEAIVATSSLPLSLAVGGGPGAGPVAAIVVELATLESVVGGQVELAPRGQAVVTIDGRALGSLPAMHAVLARAFGFPSFYGANLDALIDCLTDLDDPTTGMTTVHVGPGGVVVLAVDHGDQVPAEVFGALVDVIAFVNFRRRELGGRAILTIAASR